MTGERNRAYLRHRAEEERRRADAADGLPARLAHRRLAELYDREADDLDGPTRLFFE